MSHYSKHCAECGKHFLISGTCADYLYKRGRFYYCSYTCWNAAERKEPSQPEQPHQLGGFSTNPKVISCGHVSDSLSNEISYGHVSHIHYKKGGE